MPEEKEPRVLIIDNDEGVVRAIQTRLTSLGYECSTAVSGSQGLSEFTGQKIDLVITDLNMPAGDGIALARAIRQISDVPIIFVTGFYDEYRRELDSIPNVSMLRKPFDTNVLIELAEAELLTYGCTLPTI